MTEARQPRHFLPNEGRVYKLGRITITFKTTAADNAGAYALCEAIEPPESGAARHRHQYDETFIVCEGQYEFRVGEEMLELGPGKTLFVPRGTPHGFKSIGPGNGRQLIISSPGGIFEAFIDDVERSMVDTGNPSKPGPAVNFGAIAAKYGIEFVD